MLPSLSSPMVKWSFDAGSTTELLADVTTDCKKKKKFIDIETLLEKYLKINNALTKGKQNARKLHNVFHLIAKERPPCMFRTKLLRTIIFIFKQKQQIHYSRFSHHLLFKK